MKKLIQLSLLSIPLLIQAENIVLDSISVNAEEVNSTIKRDYKPFQKEGYMKSAPMQQQMTIKQAMEMAGTNGDPIKALKTFAGVVSTNNDNGSELYIHGSKSRETHFRINHLPLGYIFHLGGFHSVIAPEMTGQMDAYLGGFDVTYGAMGAVVDISPKYPTGSGEGRIHIGMYDADFAYDVKLGEDTNLFISGRRSYIDLIAGKILDELDSDSEDKSKKTTFTLFPQFYDAQMILTHNVGNNAFSLEALMAQDEMKINTTMNKDRDPVANGKINAKISSNTVGLRWVYAGEDMTSNTLLYRMNTKENSEFFNDDFFVDTNSNAYGLYHESVLALDKHKLTLGMELKYRNIPVKIHSSAPPMDDFASPATLQEVIDIDKKFISKQYIGFAQDIWDISPKDHFRYGVRAWQTDFQDFGAGIDPRMAYVRDVSDDFSISMAVGRYSQLPSNIRVIEGFGNPKISTQEFADHYSMSFQKELGNNTSLVIEPYYKKFQNLAINDALNNYESVGEGEAYGIDVTYKKQVKDVNLILSYAYVNATRQLNTKNSTQYHFEGDIPHTLQLSANYKFWDTWYVSAYAKYSSGSPYTPIIGTESYVYKGASYKKPIYGDPYSKRLDDNYDLDMKIGKTYKYSNGKSLEYSIELMNINALFKKNIAGLKYNDDYERDGVYEQMGFLPAIHTTYRF